MLEDKIKLCDYAVAFVDLLGQQAEMPGRHLPTDHQEAIKLIKKSVGRIVGTQKNFQKFYYAFSSNTGLYSKLPPDIQANTLDLAPGELKWQHYSDGLVIYIPLGEGMVQSPANSIFGMLMATGCLCLMGLAAKSPLRVGIDVAWSVEYQPGELYGAALAYSYNLESKVAKWPRVVVGQGLIDYLKHYTNSATSNLSSQYRKQMSQLCLNLIQADIDSQNILHYLGKDFKRCSEINVNENIICAAQEFIESQLQHWQKEGDEKLSNRYQEILSYFQTNRAKA